MHYDEGQLVAYLDAELPDEERAEVSAHLESCEQCRQRLAALESDKQFANATLQELYPAAPVIEMPREAARHVPTRRIHWGAVAAGVAAVLFVGAMAFAPVRSMASDLLKVFRVQNVQTIDVSQADLQKISTALKNGEGHIDLKSMGEVWIDGANSQPKNVSLAEAQAAVDFPVKLPAGMAVQPQVTLQAAQTYRFKLNVEAINKALKYYGSDKTLPAGIDGKVFSVTVPPIVMAQYSDPALKGVNPDIPAEISVGQAHSPELVVPEGVDASELRSVLLSLPFIPQSVRDQLASMTDWQSTLLIPNVGGSASNITLEGGVPAVVMTPKGPFVEGRNEGELPVTSTVVWNDGGVVRAVGGPINEETAIKLANSIMR